MGRLEVLQLTVQVRVREFDEGAKFYQTLLGRPADFIPHEGFAEWELLRGC